MPLRKAPFWTSIYYRAIEEYFWRPQAIGRISNPKRPAKPWTYWKSKLASQEVALNHILELLFHIAPQEMLDLVVSELLGSKRAGFELVVLPEGVVDQNIVQPDLILSNGATLVFIEMKVDSKIGIDQFVKYAVASYLITQDEPGLCRTELIVLGREVEYSKLWKRSKLLGLNSDASVRAVSLRGLAGDESVWSERGVQRFLEKRSGVANDIAKVVENIGLVHADYQTFARALSRFAASEATAERLVSGVLEEMKGRGLV